MHSGAFTRVRHPDITHISVPGKSWLRRQLPRFAAMLALGGGLLLIAGPLFAANFEINSTDDTSTAGTLRHALEQAALDGTSDDTITFHTSLGGTTINLGSLLPNIEKTTGKLTITGLGPGQLTINGNNSTRIFFVLAGDVVIENMTLTGGAATGGSGGNSQYGGGGGGGLGAGGAVFVNKNASVTLRNATLIANAAQGGAGGGTQGTSSFGGGGGGGLQGHGGNAPAEFGGGGGGGFFGNGSSTTGVNTSGGGGGGILLNASNSTGGIAGGNGGAVADSGADAPLVGGGGGGGGLLREGGDGNDFGGGGGFGESSSTVTSGGFGGFGGGGGGGPNIPAVVNTGGFGAGDGGAAATGGDGGDGLGGALFVREGGELVLENVTVQSNQATKGSGGGGTTYTGQDGVARGNGLYVMQNTDALFRVTSGNTSTVEDSIEGEGSLTKDGSGTLNLNTATYKLDAGIAVDEGLLNVNSAVESDVQVKTDGQLGGSGTITGDVVVNGTLAPGNSIGTLNITGNYTHGAGAAYQVEINSAGASDKLIVSGTANLNGGTVNVVSESGTYTHGTKYTFLEAGSVVGGFDGIADDLAFFDAQLGYTSTTAFFTLVANSADYPDLARTINQLRVAYYLQQHDAGASGEFQQFLDNVKTMSGDQARAAFDSLTGEVHGSYGQLNVQNITQMYMMLSQQAGGAQRGIAASSNDLQYSLAPAPTRQSNQVVLVSYDEATQTPVIVRCQNSCLDEWRGWVQGYGLGGYAQSDGNAAGANYGIGGTLFGVEKWVDQTHTVGFWGGYANLSLSTNGPSQSTEGNNLQFGGFIRGEQGQHYYLLAAAGGLDDYTSQRFIPGGGLNLQAQGKTTGSQGSLWLERGMKICHGGCEFQPLCALNYIHVRQNGFTETGAGALNLNVSDLDTDALRGILGGRAAWNRQTSSGICYRPEIHAMWLHEFLNTETSLNTNLTGPGGPSFATQGLDYGRDWLMCGGGLSLQLTQQLSLTAAYDTQINQRQVLHLGSGSLQYTW